MIKANELRVGNWVYDKRKRSNNTVDAYDFNDVFLNDNIDLVIEFFNPIELTDEIVKKFGFDFRLLTKYIGYYSPTVNGRSIRIWEKGKDCFCYSPNDFEAVNLMYVHQLQNLYFALMCEELQGFLYGK
jgi:hypothetical protein